MLIRVGKEIIVGLILSAAIVAGAFLWLGVGSKAIDVYKLFNDKGTIRVYPYISTEDARGYTSGFGYWQRKAEREGRRSGR